MTQPEKVVGFLDFSGANWDPSLAFVMGGAVVVYYLGQRHALGRQAPLLAGDTGFQLPTATRIDAPMALGNLVFGVGWGLAGLCPGPALVTSVAGLAVPVQFLMAMAFGMYAYGAVAERLLARPAPVVDGGAGWRERALAVAADGRMPR
jgi:uncharacterized membrane protein YedE/YeeE